MYVPRGVESQWRTIYRHIHDLPVGSMVDMDFLRKLLPGAPDGSLRTAFHRAMKEMETVDQRSFVTEWGVGYRVAAATEHAALARRQQVFARRRIDVGLRKAASANLSELTADERRQLAMTEDHLRRSRSFLKQLERRSGDENAVEVAAAKAVAQPPKAVLAVTEEDLTKLYALLERNGIKRDLTD